MDGFGAAYLDLGLGYRFTPKLAPVSGLRGYGREGDRDEELGVTHVTIGIRAEVG